MAFADTLGRSLTSTQLDLMAMGATRERGRLAVLLQAARELVQLVLPALGKESRLGLLVSISEICLLTTPACFYAFQLVGPLRTS